MNLFSSGEHINRWESLIPGSDAPLTVPDRAFTVGTESRLHWVDRDYFSRWLPLRAGEREAATQKLSEDRR